MDQMTYERPREKLRSRGISFLTNAELIQVILGSGTATISAAKLAKKVAEQVVAGLLNYDELVAIRGIGHARACQLLASVELGRRVITANQTTIQSLINETLLHSDARAMPSRILCVWLNGAGEEMDRKFYDVAKGELGNVLARRIFADVVSVGAHSLCIVISRGRRSLIPATSDLTLLKAIKEAAILFQVRVNFVHAVNTKSVEDWSAEV
jgi:DNA repair protein RadC